MSEKPNDSHDGKSEPRVPAAASFNRAKSFLETPVRPSTMESKKEAIKPEKAMAGKLMLVKQMSRPAVALRMKTHGGEHNPQWRQRTALKPEPEQNWEALRPVTPEPTRPLPYIDEKATRPEIIHVQSLIHHDPRLASLKPEDFIIPNDILIDKDSDDPNAGLLGEGSQGTIIKATIVGRGPQCVAVKCSESAEILDEFCIARRFDHPNVLKAIGFSVAEYAGDNSDDEDDRSDSSWSSASSADSLTAGNLPKGRWFYMAVYEYCEKNNLYKYLKKNPGKSQEVPYLKMLFAGLLSGLEHMHSKGYVHSDLKPENILVGDDLQPRVADFGLSQKISDRMHPQGTPSYLAPEVVNAWFCPRDPHRFTDKIDIFSLGVMAVNIVTNKYPFKRTTARLRNKLPYSQLELHALFTLPKKRVEEMAQISAMFASLVEMCLKREPEQRPSAAELLASLSQAS